MGRRGDPRPARHRLGPPPAGPESTTAYERAQVTSLAAEARTSLARLDAAPADLAAPGVGACELCGAPIGAERLDAVPATRRCVTCADRP